MLNTKEEQLEIVSTLGQVRTGDFWWKNEESESILSKGYLLKKIVDDVEILETVEEAIDRITTSIANRLKMPHLKESFKELIVKGWMSLSSPVWANAGTKRGLPISCFNVHIPDTVEGVADKLAEVIMQTKIGGGTSAYFGEMRERGAIITDNGNSSGPVSFMELFNSAMNVIAQGTTRRGAFAAYLDIDHPDIEEFLQIKSIGNPIQNIFFGICIPDYWMKEMIDGDKQKRDLWAKILTSRQEKGLPYLFFIDNANKGKPIIYKETDSFIKSSNLCSEIMLPSNAKESFICCLGSMNVELYDEWKDTKAVRLATYFLDGVLQEFIDKTEDQKHLQATRRFAIRHRAIGLGVLGWHSYLQKNKLAFDSFEAKQLNVSIFRHIQEESYEASINLGKKLGVAPIFNEVLDTLDIPRRNTTTMAVAPTTSSSAILGQSSPGIEPYPSNYFKAGLAKGNFIRKNPYLEILLEEKGFNTEMIWQGIMYKDGSVQHLDFLTQEEKDIFKTFSEVSQLGIIQQAAARQRFIDQGQSVNLNIPPHLPVKEVNKLYIEAWSSGLKAVYYQRSKSVSKELVQNLVHCSSCES